MLCTGRFGLEHSVVSQCDHFVPLHRDQQTGGFVSPHRNINLHPDIFISICHYDYHPKIISALSEYEKDLLFSHRNSSVLLVLTGESFLWSLKTAQALF